MRIKWPADDKHAVKTLGVLFYLNFGGGFFQNATLKSLAALFAAAFIKTVSV